MSSSQSSITRKNISVHVVDNDSDHPIVHCLQLILIGKMRDFEMKVKAVTQGNKALDLIRKGASFDLVIMDMDMSTNGFEQQAFMESGLEGCFEKTLKADVIASFLS
ncbi:hypothetical protein Peur_041000 [Populus x canadensis]